MGVAADEAGARNPPSPGRRPTQRAGSRSNSRRSTRRAHRPRRGERTTPQHVAVASAASAALAATVGGSRRIIRHPAGMTVYYHLGMSDEYLYALDDYYLIRHHGRLPTLLHPRAPARDPPRCPSSASREATELNGTRRLPPALGARARDRTGARDPNTVGGVPAALIVHSAAVGGTLQVCLGDTSHRSACLRRGAAPRSRPTGPP